MNQKCRICKAEGTREDSIHNEPRTKEQNNSLMQTRYNEGTVIQSKTSKIPSKFQFSKPAFTAIIKLQIVNRLGYTM